MSSNLRASFYKIWQVAFFEYQSRVLTWRFWLSILAIPVVLAGMFGITLLASLLAQDHAPVGVVGAGDLPLSAPPGEHFTYTFLAFADQPAAQAALQAHKIQAYFVLPAGYLEARELELFYLKRPSAILTQEFNSLLRRQALANLPAIQAYRLQDGSRVILQAGQLEMPGQISTLARLMIALSAVYVLVLFNSQAAGYMITTVAEERTTRTLEMLVTSLSHTQLLVGKIAGQLAVVFTQAALLGGLPLLFMLMLRLAILPVVGEIFTWQQLLVFLVAGFLNLVLVSVLLSTLGITLFDASETQLAGAFFGICMLAPLILYQALADAPSGPVSLFLTFFPFSGVGALIVRMALGSVPAWQVLLSLLLLLASTWAAFWLAGRLFWRGLQDRQPPKFKFSKFKTLFRRFWKPRNA